MPEHLLWEDQTLAFRSILAGEVFYINEPLIKYRLHGTNMWLREYKRSLNWDSLNWDSLRREENRILRDFRALEVMYQAFILDVEKAKEHELVDATSAEQIITEAKRLHEHFAIMSKFIDSGFFAKCRIFRALRREGLHKNESRVLVRRLLPRPILLPVRLAWGYAALARGRLRKA
jgi:hypothetical protein